MRLALLLSVATLAGCASSQGSSGSPAPDQTVRIPSSGGGTATTLSIASSTSAAVKTLPVSMERIWSVLPAVYDSMGIPVMNRDAATHTIGNPSLKIRRRLADVPLSRYLECGDTQGAPSADSYEILLSMNTTLQSGGADATTVTTSVDGLGRPVFVSAEYIHCGSKGGLEKRFFAVLNAELMRK